MRIKPTCAYEKYIYIYIYSYALAGFILLVNITHIFILTVKLQCMVMKYLKRSWSMLPAIVAEVCCSNTPPTSSFTEYAGSLSWQQCYYQPWGLHWQIAHTHILQILALALVGFPLSIIGTVRVIASPSTMFAVISKGMPHILVPVSVWVQSVWLE